LISILFIANLEPKTRLKELEDGEKIEQDVCEETGNEKSFHIEFGELM